MPSHNKEERDGELEIRQSLECKGDGDLLGPNDAKETFNME